jgi:Cd2+/Zn2+-exporting ATPase
MSHNHNRQHHHHDHGSAPAFLPHALQERWPLFLAALAGLFWLAGWAGHHFWGMSESLALGFFLFSYLAGGYDIASHALPALFRGKLDTDVLMLLAAAGAAILGQWAEGAFLLFLFALGHAGEHYALDRARDAVSALGKLMPATARIKQGAAMVVVPVDQVEPGQIAVVRPGDRIPVDGVVLAGVSAVDESPITGESAPALKEPGQQVFAGSINHQAVLEVQVTHRAADATLSRIMQMVEKAQQQKGAVQRTTERFMRWFVPAVLLLVLTVVALPPLLGWMPLQTSFYRGMLLLVAASPCALAVGTPAAVLAGIAQAARHGVLIKGGRHLEALAGIQAMAFDKTGTLTQGRFQVTDIVPFNGVTPDALLSLAAGAELHSNHPLARAVVQEAQARQLTLAKVSDLQELPGRGVQGMHQGQRIAVGSPRLFQEASHAAPTAQQRATVDALAAGGKSAMLIQVENEQQGVLALADTPRPGARAALTALHKLGVRHRVMLTGDHAQAAAATARQVGVTETQAQLLPQDKLQAIQALQRAHGAVAMVGDGVNDAPALAAATVGIAMGAAGTAVALETADVALMADDLGKLPFAVGLSRASRRIIIQNLVIALGVILLLVAASLLGRVDLSQAVILHEGSTLVVVFNALRLLRYRGY